MGKQKTYWEEEGYFEEVIEKMGLNKEPLPIDQIKKIAYEAIKSGKGVPVRIVK